MLMLKKKLKKTAWICEFLPIIIIETVHSLALKTPVF